MPEETESTPKHFIQEIIDEDNRSGKWDGRVQTRFPPEPNGHLHIGHAKSILLNFTLAEQYGGKCNLRFDDTNPVKEEDEFVRGIIADVRWLGCRWDGAADDDPRAGVLFASSYFQQLYDWAAELIKKGLAYVDDQSVEQIREQRGSLTSPGRNSPCRERPVDESLDLFVRMKKGEYPDGGKVVRAKIDMTSPNMNLRDPVMYRILHATHHRTGDEWCVYPMYDWAHGLEDSIERVTHSICTLEFENHRPLYDWFIDAINQGRTDDGSGPWGAKIMHPQQIEFARLNFNYTVMSKRKLLQLVEERRVSGWDDPRLPTLTGLKRRGYTSEAIRELCSRVGVAKFDGVSEMALLEFCVRQDLNKRAPRVMCVLRPLKVVIENYPEGQVEELDAINNPEDESAGTRKVPFSRELYIERNDFMEDAPRKFFRLAPGREVRLRYAYFITCTGVIKNDAGDVVELRCTYDPATRGGDAPDGRKVKGTLHWVSAARALDVEVRLYDHLFSSPDPEAADLDGGKSAPVAAAPRGGRSPEVGTDEPTPSDWKSNLNPNSLEVLTGCKLEPNWRTAAAEAFPDGIPRVQFERLGYFCLDRDSSASEARDSRPIFNRTVTLRDTWAKIAKKR
ncbi:MAG: glutamine--tRNA ligase/YqeY domain fusion protein [Planctomycetes bacterium]|nr:glutamine--tRNA ligase/YqeY domain fusion protein [Planctomycetota bacterium]